MQVATARLAYFSTCSCFQQNLSLASDVWPSLFFCGGQKTGEIPNCMRRRKRSHESTRACQLWPCASKTYGSTPEAYTRTAFCPDRFRTTSPPAPGGCLVPTTFTGADLARWIWRGKRDRKATVVSPRWIWRGNRGCMRNRGFTWTERKGPPGTRWSGGLRFRFGWLGGQAARQRADGHGGGEVAFQAAVLHAAAQVAAAARAHA